MRSGLRTDVFHHVSELRSNRVACNLNTLDWEIDHAADTVVCEATSTKGTLKLAQCISISSSRICQRQLSKASALDLPGSARLVNMREARHIRHISMYTMEQIYPEQL